MYCFFLLYVYLYNWAAYLGQDTPGKEIFNLSEVLSSLNKGQKKNIIQKRFFYTYTYTFFIQNILRKRFFYTYTYTFFIQNILRKRSFIFIF